MFEYRKNFLTWDEYFMSLCALSASRSHMITEAACIVDKDKRILSLSHADIPYNIRSKNINGYEFPAEFYTSALSNAIYTFKGRNQEFIGSTLYLLEFPNCEQSRQISQARIKNVIYLHNNLDMSSLLVSKRILESAGVNVVPYFDDKYNIREYIDFFEKLKKTIKKHIGEHDNEPLSSSEYYMGVAALSALRSKDPSTQVGACLVGTDGKIMSIGYNGTPYGMKDEELPWYSPGESTGDLLTTKDPYIVHAEINVFDNYRGNMQDFKDSYLYLIYSPCETCSKRISFAGLNRVVYLREYTKHNMSIRSNRWLNSSRTLSSLYNPSHNYTKEECIEFFEETTGVIKKYLKK